MLRTSSAELHRDLEMAMDRCGWFDSLGAYREYLLRLELFNRRFCRSIDEGCRELGQRWSLRSHLTWIAHDLTYFKLEPLPESAIIVEPISISGRASAFGASYVVLGSSLGAKFLAPRVAKLHLSREGGLTYLSELGASKGWSRFVGDLENEASLPAADLIRAAQDTFASYKSHLTGSLTA